MEKNQYHKHDEKWRLNFGFSPGTKEEMDKKLANGVQNLTPHLQGAAVTSYSNICWAGIQVPRLHTFWFLMKSQKSRS